MYGRTNIHDFITVRHVYSPCAKKPPRVRLQLFKLHSEDMFSHNAPHWHSPGKLGALLKVCRYSTGFLGFFRRLVLKHNLKFQELNLFRPSGETVERHPTQMHSLEIVSPCHFSSESISFLFGDTVAYFTRLTENACTCPGRRRGGRTKRTTKACRPKASATFDCGILREIVRTIFF